MASHGLAAVTVHGGSGELDVIANVDVEGAIEAVKEALAQPEPFVIGVKVRLSNMVGQPPFRALSIECCSPPRSFDHWLAGSLQSTNPSWADARGPLPGDQRTA